MRQSSELLLTYLLNATWQVLLIAAAASLAAWFLRQAPVRYRHYVWTSALLLAFVIPLMSVVGGAVESISVFNMPQNTVKLTELPLNQSSPANLELANHGNVNSPFHLNAVFAWILTIGYLAVLVFYAFRLVQAFRFALRVKRDAREIVDNARVSAVIDSCAAALGQKNKSVRVLSSDSLHVPVTFGLFRPVIILPDELLRENNPELLTSAIGHEYIHITRRDYSFNLVYEFLYLPLSFHPAAALIRRYIKQTRELSCDELVAQRIIRPEAYARSLVKLASSAPTLRRLSITTTVGIADADILEARIMSLLKKPKSDVRWKRIALIVASLLLVVPCVAAGAFAMRFEMQPNGEALVQEPVSQEREKRWGGNEEKEKIMREEEIKREIQNLRGRFEVLAQEPVSQEKEKEKLKLEERVKIKREIEELEGRLAGDGGEQRGYAVVLLKPDLERERHIAEEQKAIMVNQAALVRLARIQMDQAIQIATSLHPGKVLECTLNAEQWEEPGKLAKDARVFYHVEVLSGEEPNQVITHVLVNAVDGTIIRAEKELPRKMLRQDQP